jgi:putative FmdB family regulatory protein
VPLYEYKCLSCGRLSERIEPVSGPHLKKCPHCRGKVERLVSRSAIQFKGSGWYVTDYAGKSSAPETSSGASTDAGKEGAKEGGAKETAAKESGSSKEASPKDKKPAKKK